MAKETHHMAKETYHVAKETYHMAKETYHVAKETNHVASDTFLTPYIPYALVALYIHYTHDLFLTYRPTCAWVVRREREREERERERDSLATNQRPATAQSMFA